MSNEFPLSDRYGDEMQNPAFSAREYERAMSLLPQERAYFGQDDAAWRCAEDLRALRDENGFPEEPEEN